MSSHLIRDLDNLHRSLLSMCAKVEELIHQAVQELSSPKEGRIAELTERDNEIDRYDVEIEEDCLKTLALHQPVAIDLRRVTTVLKITGELERVADLAVHVAERANCLPALSKITIPPELHQMVEIAIQMLHQSIDAYVNLNAEHARKICIEDERVDELNRTIIQSLTELMQKSPDLIVPAMHLFSASRHIERIADHATNIAEDVVYLVEGAIIRHRPQG